MISGEIYFLALHEYRFDLTCVGGTGLGNEEEHDRDFKLAFVYKRLQRGKNWFQTIDESNVFRIKNFQW